MHIEVDHTLSAVELDVLERRITAEIYEKYQVALTGISVYAVDHDDPETDGLYRAIRDEVTADEHVLQMHGFNLDKKTKTVVFDLIISFDVPDRKIYYQRIVEQLRQAHPGYTFYVTLDTDEGICYRTDHAFENALAVGNHFRFHETFSSYAERFVAEPYREAFLQFIDPETIRARLSRELMISCRYLRIRDGVESYEMLRMAGVRRPEDRGDHMVHAVGVGFTDIDQEMRDTMARNEALRVALEVAEDASKAKTAFLSNMSVKRQGNTCPASVPPPSTCSALSTIFWICPASKAAA